MHEESERSQAYGRMREAIAQEMSRTLRSALYHYLNTEVQRCHRDLEESLDPKIAGEIRGYKKIMKELGRSVENGQK
jgi:hypothetical protein